MLPIPLTSEAEQLMEVRIRMLYATHLTFLDAMVRIGVAVNARNAAVTIATTHEGDARAYALRGLQWAESEVLKMQRADGLNLPRRPTALEVTALQEIRRVAGVR